MNACTFRRGSQFLLLALLCLALAGCGGAPTAPAEKSPSAAASETWDAHFIGDDRIGYTHTSTRPADDGLVETRQVTALSLRRFGQTTSQTIEVVSLEEPDGLPRSYQCTVKSGDTAMIDSTGSWRGDELRITATTQGQTAQLTLPWKPDYLGPFGDSQALRRQPLQPGERRTITSLVPSLNQLAEVEFNALDYETTTLLDGEQSLLRVETIVHVRTPAGAEQIASTAWLNEQGEALKSYLPQLKQTTYRTTRERATAAGSGTFDLGDATTVRLARPLARPHQTKTLTYRASLTEGKIEGVFVAGPTQRVKRIDERTCELTVTAITPHTPPEIDPPDTPPAPADSAPNTLIQSDDLLVTRMAQSVLPDETDAWKLAVALESHVHRAIRRKNFSQAFLSAAQVAQELEGDCTEHAVLLAALCRARGIPARGAMGLVYYPEGQGFAYHMWTEVWIADRWIPLDATLGQGGIGAAHLKLAHSNFAGADAYSAFLPVLRVLGQLKLEVIE